MKNELIDTLTRALAAPASGRSPWRVVTTVATTSFWTLLGKSLAEPQSALASTDVSKNCMMLNHDGTCPDGTRKRTQPGNVPTMNGCGPEGGTIKLPQGYGRADYTGSCNTHDVCYEECDTPKVKCDENFRDDMFASCDATYPGVLNSLLRLGCKERAYAYYQAVLHFGDDAWMAAQKKACECCSESIKHYCNCNKTCYDNWGECDADCHVTLGCFTAICGPASEDQCPA